MYIYIHKLRLRKHPEISGIPAMFNQIWWMMVENMCLIYGINMIYGMCRQVGEHNSNNVSVYGDAWLYFLPQDSLWMVAKSCTTW